MQPTALPLTCSLLQHETVTDPMTASPMLLVSWLLPMTTRLASTWLTYRSMQSNKPHAPRTYHEAARPGFRVLLYYEPATKQPGQGLGFLGFSGFRVR